MKLRLPSRPRRLLGIDIGTDTLKLALCVNGKVLKTARAPMPREIFDANFRIKSNDMMARTLIQAMRENGLRASRVSIVLSERVSFLRNITVKKMSEKQLRLNLPYEFIDYLEGDINEYVFDYAMISDPRTDEGEEMDLMGVAIRRDLIEESKDWLGQAGLRLSKIVPNESAYIALIHNAPSEVRYLRECCFVNLGYAAIRLVVLRGDMHTATRVLSPGLSRLDHVVADAMDVDTEVAHKYILSNYMDCLNLDPCIQVYNEIALELMRAINFYGFSNPDSNIEAVTFCGGGADNAPLRSAIARELGLDVREAGDWVKDGAIVSDCCHYIQAIGGTMD